MTKSEAQTRSELIDQKLAQSGWNVKDPTQVVEEFDILTALPPGVAEPRTPYEGHARRMEKIFDKLYPQYHGELAKVLVSDDPRVYGKGGLLDTGIDVREIVNLVFAKPVYSYTKFWQMVGRGSRLLETSKAKPWCLEKDVFLILDCWDNFEYFKLNPKGKELKPQLPLPVRLVGLRLNKIEKANDSGNADIAAREIAKLRVQIAALPKATIAIKEAAAALARLDDDNFWISLSHDRLEFLRTEIKPLFRTVSEADFKAKAWLAEVLDEWRWNDETTGAEGKTPDEYLRDVSRHTQKSPFANANFLKNSFLLGCKTAGLFDPVATGEVVQ